MRVTVCQLRDAADDLARDWELLVAECRASSSELVLLPEMPFFPWFAWTREVEPEEWRRAVEAHDRWDRRLPELGGAVVVGSRPVTDGGRRLNEGFVWDPEAGYRGTHHKVYLPDEEYFWEASWYERGSGGFAPFDCGAARGGLLICTELWFGERARAYGRQGVQLLASPRATGASSADKWLAGGRTAAVASGAFGLSSNRGGRDARGFEWAGQGWIVEPEEGEVLATTTAERPAVTVDLDLTVADQAKTTYPRYVVE